MDIIMHRDSTSFVCDSTLGRMIGQVSEDGQHVTVETARVSATIVRTRELQDLAEETLREAQYGGVDDVEIRSAERRVAACEGLLPLLLRFERWNSEGCGICGGRRPSPWCSWERAECRC